MEEEKIEKIKSNNEKINKVIATIIQKYKDIKATGFNEKDELDETVKKIVEIEMKKNVLIYLYEFPQFEKINLDDLKVDVETREDKKNKADARGSSDGVKLYPGMQKFIDGDLLEKGIESQEINGIVFATKVFGTGDGIKVPEPDQVTHKKVESQRDYADYFAEILRYGKIDIDWILDVLPHESMHIFIEGKGTLVEGTTERLARECADKYGLRLTPSSHTKETEVISKIEKIIGRENLAQAMSLTNAEKQARKINKKEVDKTRLERMEELIDAKLGKGTFQVLQDNFEKEYARAMTEEGKKDLIASRSYYSQELTILEKWINNNSIQISKPKELQRDESQLDQIMEYQEREWQILKEILLTKTYANNKETTAGELHIAPMLEKTKIPNAIGKATFNCPIQNKEKALERQERDRKRQITKQEEYKRE